MRPHYRLPLVLGLVLLGALAAAAAFSAASVATRAVEYDGRPAAEVLVGDMPVIELRTSAGGLTPMRRAGIVAERLQAAIDAQPQGAKIRVASISHGQGLYADNRLIVAVYDAEASAHNSTPLGLVQTWRDNLVRAWGGSAQSVAPPAPAAADSASVAGESQPAAADPKPAQTDWTGTAQKWVPIVSVEQSGLSIGAAQVAGPTAQIAKVKAVAELGLSFQSVARIYAYIPTSSLNVTTLDRVQGVSVWATGDVRLVKF